MGKLLLVVSFWIGFSFSSLSYANAGASSAVSGVAVCTLGGVANASSFRVLLSSLLTLYNILPIKIGGVTVLGMSGLENFVSVSSPICVCPNPLPRVGIVVEFHEPIALVDVVKIPYCSPTLGLALPAVLPSTQFSVGEEGESSNLSGVQSQRRGYQLHYFKYYPWGALQLLTDFICLDPGMASDFLDLLYPTELDPLYQWDVLANILSPESLLFANPVASFACSVDALASTVGFPLTPLYWCAGSWGLIFPLSKASLTKDAPQAQGLALSKLLFKMHRELILWCSAGKAGLCGRFPCPIWIKGEYSMYPLYPVIFPLRQPLGRNALVGWGFGQDVPVVNRHNTVWMVYRQRSCCAF